MKKIRMSICVTLIALAMFYMTGCGSGNDTTETTPPTQATTTTTTSAAKESTTNGSTTNGTTNNNGTDTGVIEGLVDDVERGVDDVTGNKETTTAGADESR